MTQQIEWNMHSWDISPPIKPTEQFNLNDFILFRGGIWVIMSDEVNKTHRITHQGLNRNSGDSVEAWVETLF